MIDGFSSLLVKSEGGEVEEIIDEESGMLISAMLRQYFMALRTVGQWSNLSSHWNHVADECGHTELPSEVFKGESHISRLKLHEDKADGHKDPWHKFLRSRLGFSKKPHDEDSDHFDTGTESDHTGSDSDSQIDLEILLMKKFWGRWAHRAGIKSKVCDCLKESECAVDWTRVIAPVLEGRIKIVGS